MLKSKRTRPSALYLYPAHRGAVGFVCGHRPDKEIIPYWQKTQSKTREAGLGIFLFRIWYYLIVTARDKLVSSFELQMINVLGSQLQ